MSNGRPARAASHAIKRLASLPRPDDDGPLDEDGLPVLDPPGLSWSGRYARAMSRYALALWVAPYASQYLSRTLDIAVIVDDVLRHVHKDFETGRQMDYGRYFERYARRVEAAAYGRAPEDRARAWQDHAARLRTRYGNPTERWMKR